MASSFSSPTSSSTRRSVSRLVSLSVKRTPSRWPSRRWIDASMHVTCLAFSRRTGCSKVRIGRTMELDFTRGPIGPNLLDDPARANHDVATLDLAIAPVGLDPAWPEPEEHPPLAFLARVPAHRGGKALA